MRRAPLKALLTPAIVLGVVVVLANLVALVTWTLPQWDARRGVAGGAAGIENARRRIEPSLQVVRDTYGRVDQAEIDLQDFRERLVTTVGGAELLTLLDGAGDGVGIDLDDATLQYAPIAELGVVQLGITFPVTGTYSAVRRLLDELVSLPVFLVIDGVALQSFNNAGPPGGQQPIRVDLAISVFVEDTEFVPPPATAPRRPLVDARQISRLAQAAEGNDPDDIADELLTTLASLPPLPVDSASLVVDLGRLDAPIASSTSGRNLFSVVLPPPPPMTVMEAPEVFVEPEPVLPIRLVGVLVIDGRLHASITDERDVFVVEAGQTLPNGVEVAEIDAESVTVIFNNERTVLRLEGTRP